MSPTDVIILGVNGNCIDIADAVELLSRRSEPLRLLGFLDDDTATHGKTIAGVPVLGSITDASKFGAAKFINGIGSPRSYKRKPAVIAAANVADDRWVTIVHPMASISRHARLGHGTVVLANSVVGARAVVGNHVMVLQNSVISHDAIVGDYTAIATGVCISGDVTIGANCYLGSNCVIRDGLRIGERALVGLGAVVTRETSGDCVVTGNPARVRAGK